MLMPGEHGDLDLVRVRAFAVVVQDDGFAQFRVAAAGCMIRKTRDLSWERMPTTEGTASDTVAALSPPAGTATLTQPSSGPATSQPKRPSSASCPETGRGP